MTRVLAVWNPLLSTYIHPFQIVRPLERRGDGKRVYALNTYVMHYAEDAPPVAIPVTHDLRA